MDPLTHYNLQMGDLKICRHRLPHHPGDEGQVDVEPKPFITSQGLILQCLDLLIHLLETSLYISILIMVSLRVLRR